MKGYVAFVRGELGIIFQTKSQVIRTLLLFTRCSGLGVCSVWDKNDTKVPNVQIYYFKYIIALERWGKNI